MRTILAYFKPQIKSLAIFLEIIFELELTLKVYSSREMDKHQQKENT
jgi:hypothetical protein